MSDADRQFRGGDAGTYGMDPWNKVAGVPQAKLAEYGNPVSEVPIRVTSTGHPAGALSYAGLQARSGGAILVPQPPPSPLQQWIREGDGKAQSAFTEGSPVKICHLMSPETRRHNNLTGDIKTVSTGDDGSLVFDVICPLLPDAGGLKFSEVSRMAATKNRRLMAPEYGINEDQAEDEDYWRSDPSGQLPPYVSVGGIGSEKLDPKSEGVVPGTLPVIRRPPIWGKPLSQEEYLAIQHRMEMAQHMGMAHPQQQIHPDPAAPAGHACMMPVPGGYNSGPQPGPYPGGMPHAMPMQTMPMNGMPTPPVSQVQPPMYGAPPYGGHPGMGPMGPGVPNYPQNPQGQFNTMMR